MYDFFDSISIFMDRGGVVLYAIFATSFALWLMLSERFIYINFYAKELQSLIISQYSSLKNKNTWQATMIRDQLIVKYRTELNQYIPLIKTIIVVTPFLGLLGTVTGMIEIFDIMAVTGSSDAKAMASGVSRATIPTLAGMMVSISGMFFISRYSTNSRIKIEKLKEVLI